MTSLVLFFHVLVCILLATIILMQSGRGGGLTEMFSSAESMFGANTSSVLIKGTTILAVIFLATSLSLAFLSTAKDKSLVTSKAVSKAQPKEETGLDVEVDEGQVMPEAKQAAEEASAAMPEAEKAVQEAPKTAPQAIPAETKSE